jgi:ADP-heptose:LPS heptosyltransferase
MKGGSPRGPVAHYAPGIASFADTAACIEQLDAVLSVDAGIANLAVMIGKPTGVLVNPTGEWRWGRHSTHTPWMASAYVLRQTTMGDWHGVIDLAAQWLMQHQ